MLVNAPLEYASVRQSIVGQYDRNKLGTLDARILKGLLQLAPVIDDCLVQNGFTYDCFKMGRNKNGILTIILYNNHRLRLSVYYSTYGNWVWPVLSVDSWVDPSKGLLLKINKRLPLSENVAIEDFDSLLKDVVFILERHL